MIRMQCHKHAQSFYTKTFNDMQFENQTKDVSPAYILSSLNYCFGSCTRNKQGTLNGTM